MKPPTPRPEGWAVAWLALCICAGCGVALLYVLWRLFSHTAVAVETWEREWD